MPRTEQSAARMRKPAPESRMDSEAADLADAYGPRCAALISDTMELRRAPLGGVPFSCLTHMTFASPPIASPLMATPGV